MTLSGDQQRLLVFNSDSTVSSYGLGTGLWSVSTIGIPAGSLRNLMAVAYPTTGSIYIPSGYGQGLEMLVYEPTTNAVRGQKMSPDLTAGGSLTGYSFVWSNSRGTMLLYGGMSGPLTPNPNLFEYNPKDGAWSRLTTEGDSPGDVSDHCMVSALNGTKMVLFGGRPVNGPLSRSIFILDVETLRWQKGVDLDPSLARTGMACTMAGASFVAWGGDNNWTNLAQLTVPVIYDIKSQKWTNTFSSREFVLADTNDAPTESGPDKTEVWVIIGCATVAAGFILAFLFVRIRKVRRMRDEEAAYLPKEDDNTRPTSLEREDLPDQGHDFGKEEKNPSKENLATRRCRSPQSFILTGKDDGPLSFSAMSPPLSPHSVIPDSPTHRLRYSHENGDNLAEQRTSESSDYFNEAGSGMHHQQRGSMIMTLIPDTPSPRPNLPYSQPPLTQMNTPWGYSRPSISADDQRLHLVQSNYQHNPGFGSPGVPPVGLVSATLNFKDDVGMFRHKGPYAHESSCSLDIATRRNPQMHTEESLRFSAEAEGVPSEALRPKNRFSWLQNRVSMLIGNKR
ncbi:hypothetical protein BGX34_005730 [Mortierella sp. NVP85]|nr:hypothetical protein BGX34_005730 [Mortierella sp. NVP85]